MSLTIELTVERYVINYRIDSGLRLNALKTSPKLIKHDKLYQTESLQIIRDPRIFMQVFVLFGGILCWFDYYKVGSSPLKYRKHERKQVKIN